MSLGKVPLSALGIIKLAAFTIESKATMLLITDPRQFSIPHDQGRRLSWLGLCQGLGLGFLFHKQETHFIMSDRVRVRSNRIRKIGLINELAVEYGFLFKLAKMAKLRAKNVE